MNTEIIKELETKIRTAIQNYYEDGTSELSDSEFDQCIKTLTELDPTNPVLAEVGTDHTEGFTKRKHITPMLSLEKVKQDVEDGVEPTARLKKWLMGKYQDLEAAGKGVNDMYVSIEPKLDGCAAEAIYAQGKLLHVITRGTGLEGDDITANVRSCFPETIPVEDWGTHCAIRGELCIPDADFARINAAQEEAGLPLFKNSRNLCSGTIKSKVPINRGVQFYIHGFIDYAGDSNKLDMKHIYDNENSPFQSKHYGMRLLSPGMVDSICQLVMDNKDTDIGTATDGAVIKFISFAVQQLLGEAGKYPRYAVAFKYKSENVETVVNDIVYQIGAKTGRATPVAIIEPVLIAGSIVSQVSLSNAGLMASLGIRVGSRVIVEKANEIIPHIVEVIDGEPYALDLEKECPECGEMMVLVQGNKNTAHYVCENASCVGRKLSRLTSAYGLDCLNILGLGEEYCALFLKKYPEMTPFSIFLLSQDEYPDAFSPLQKLNIFNAVKCAKEAPMSRWICAMQIPTIAKTIAAKLSLKFPDLFTMLSNINQYSASDLDISENAYNTLVNYFNDNHTLDYMRAIGVNAKSDMFAAVGEHQPLTNLTFVVTGSFEYGRKELEKLIQLKGGVLKSSVSRKVQYLVTGSDVGATKTNKAKELGVIVITEEMLMNMINTL